MKKREFEYDELFALCYLCVGEAILIYMDEKFKTPQEGRLMIEEEIKKNIALRWKDSE